MDERTKQAVETTLETELLYNERTIRHHKFGEVRLKRPTPAQEKRISEARRRQYHADLRDDSILSRDEIEAIATRRGMWSPALSVRITDLTQRTGEAMAILDAIGFKSMEELLLGYNNTVSDLRALYPEDDEVRAAIVRYFDLTEKPNRTDREAIIDLSPSTVVDDLLDKGETERTQIEVVEQMLKVRRELMELQFKQARLYVDSLESRADRAEELAKVYYCATYAATGEYLWTRYDDIWNAEAEDIEALILELHYFINGVTEEFRESMEKYGFIKRLTDTSPSSENSPDQPQSNSDGESPVNEPTSSSPDME